MVHDPRICASQKRSYNGREKATVRGRQFVVFPFGGPPFSVCTARVRMRNTKITCTIGPSIESSEMLEKMIRGGMNVARLNMSHATHEWTREVFQRIRTASAKAGIPCAIMMDTQGPSIRTGDLPVPMEL